MQIRHSELEIPLNDPFKNDALDRKKLEPPLTQFITQSSGSFVLALDAAWGSGKTTFLKMWKTKLTDAGHACLYLNAWQTDFAKEPLVAIVGELTKAINTFAPSGRKGVVLRKTVKKAQTIAGSIFKRLISLGIKVATHGILDLEPAIEKAFADTASSIVEEDRIKEYEKSKSEIESFIKTLAKISSQVAELNPSAKVVVIIDELDRCRPTYAIELLERVKHLFDGSGVVFILGIDRSQLNHSIRSIYGSGFDATGYLRRFIDLDYRLPEPKAGDYYSHLFKRFGIEELLSKRKTPSDLNEQEQLESYLGGLMSAARMSLRVQEQIFARLRIVLQTVPTNKEYYPIILSFLLFVREWDNDTYMNIVEGKTNFDDLLPRIKALPSIKEVSQKIDQEVIEAHLLVGLTELGSTNPLWSDYERLVNSDPTAASAHANTQKAHRIIGFTRHLQFSNCHSYRIAGFKDTVERLALTNNFVSHDDDLKNS